MPHHHHHEDDKVERRVTYSVLSGIFMTGVALFSATRHKEIKLTPLELAQLGFATYRMGRMIAFDRVMETYRLPVAKTVPDKTGAGETVVPRGSGAQHALGELVSCPICSGTWVAAGLVYGMSIAPKPTRTLIAIMSSVGIAEFLNAATEAMSWASASQRVEVGQQHEELKEKREPQIVLPNEPSTNTGAGPSTNSSRIREDAKGANG